MTMTNNKWMRFLMLAITPMFIIVMMAQDAKPNDPEADALLKEISAKYKKYTSGKIELDLTIELPESDEDETGTATAWFKGDMFKIEYGDQIYTTDNVTFWNYMPEYDEVQISNYDESEVMIFSPSFILDMYNDKYIYRMKESFKKDGKTFEVLELTPTNKDEEFFKIDLTINNTDKTIQELKVYEKSGLRYIITIKKFTPNVSLTEDFFRIDDTNVENVIDLRY